MVTEQTHVSMLHYMTRTVYKHLTIKPNEFNLEYEIQPDVKRIDRT